MTPTKAKILALTALILLGYGELARAAADNNDVVLDTRGHVVQDTRGGCVRTKWMNDDNVCITQHVMQQTLVTARDLTKEQRVVYFQFDHSDLQPGAKDRLGTLANVLKSDESVKDAKIVGYADRIGSVKYNEALSMRRADTVRDYLVANGYTKASVTKTRWVGKSEAKANCPEKQTRANLIACLQKDRRVEIEIEFAQPGQGQTSDAR